jgi:hypothetical protein
MLAFCLATAAPALAGSELPPPSDGPGVKGTVVHPPGGTAFTGANLTVWLIALAVLVVVGATLILVGRRRAASV